MTPRAAVRHTNFTDNHPVVAGAVIINRRFYVIKLLFSPKNYQESFGGYSRNSC